MIIAVIIIISIAFGLFIFSRVTCGRLKSTVCLVGKTAVVTGANRGIGYEVALNLAMRGCRVIMACRSSSAENARDEIISKTNNSNVTVMKLDLASYKSIRTFVKNIKESGEKVHILINNAAVGASDSTTEDGVQFTWQTNYFGPFLLTYLLTDVLKKSAPSRVIFTTSFLEFFSDLTLTKLKANNLCEESFFTGIYQNTKLFAVICSNMFADKFKGIGITCNSVNPGIVRTDIYLDAFKKTHRIKVLILYLIGYLYFKTREDGAQTTLHAAISNELEKETGKHYWDCIEFYIPHQAKNRKFCEEVWKISEKMTYLTEEEVLNFKALIE